MDGELERTEDGRWRLRFTRELRQPPATVWRALTEPEELAHWFPTTVEGERAAGAPLRFAHREADLPAFTGEMLAFEPPSLMELRWGEDVLRLELRPHGDGTILVLLDTLGQRGKGARDAAGWHVCLEQLAARLAGEEGAGGSSWQELQARYAERFGPEAATIGPPEGALEER
jgi:uncharacterized protein YndB with AHSA1/START domain